jgi:toxin-antitoxin system PIN domain toxin
MLVVDTNVLVYAANSAAVEHARCRELVEGWRSGSEPWAATWSVLYEFARIVTHPRVLAKPLTAKQAWSFVEALLASPSFRVLVETERHAESAARTIAEVPLLAGNILHDVHTAVAMREHGVRRISTRDADFHRFTFLEVEDPMGQDGSP